MFLEVKNRLKTLGYEADDTVDGPMIDFAITKISWEIKNDCNLDVIPEGLHHFAIDMVCGEFLATKKSIGQLTGFDVENAIKSIKEGDTQITYAVTDLTSGFEWLINHLKDQGKAQMVTFRRLSW